MDKTHERKIQLILKKLGLNENEINVFLTGLKLGPSTVIELAKQTNIKRITSHAIVNRLIDKGLFLQSYSKKKRLVYPDTLDSLQKLMEKKKFEIQELEQDVKSASKILESVQTRSEKFPKTRFYKGKEGIKIMLHEVLQDRKDMHVVSDAQHFYDLIDNDFLEESLKIRNKYNIKVQMIFPTGFEHFYYTQGTYEQKLDIRVLSNESLLRGGINVWGDKVAFHCYKEGFITTTMVDDNQIANIMSFLFKSVWELAKEY